MIRQIVIRYFWIVSPWLAQRYLWLQQRKCFTVKDLKCFGFYGIMAVAKKPPRSGAYDSREVVENMEFGFRPQSWPYTVPDYVETVLERAHESSDFRLKSIKNHSKTLILQGILRLGRRCRRFESCHSDQKGSEIHISEPFLCLLRCNSWWCHL